MKKIITLIFLFSMNIFAQTSTEQTSPNVELKEGGAVIAFSAEDGFKLSEKAIKNLGVTFKRLKGAKQWTVPKSSLVHIKHSVGVYRKWDGWITMVLVKVVEKNKDTVIIQSIDLQDQDQIAITGVPFLRMTDSDLNSDTVDSCSH